MSGQDVPDRSEVPAGWDCPRGGRRGRGGGGGGRGRMFDNGDLRLIIMSLLSDRPRHGYEIIKALEERVGGGYSPSPGVVYPTLTLLEELGQASVMEERAGRKLYTLTPDGHAALAASQPVVEAILARLEIGAASRSGPPPQMVRAMENLAAAVRLRLQARAANETQIRAMAAAIDAAARAVEDL
nr:PadR family transcriptional regulator [uncultured Rhodopila sp.]